MKVLINQNTKDKAVEMVQLIADGKDWESFSDEQLWQANKTIAIKQEVKATYKLTRRLLSLAWRYRKKYELDFLSSNRKTGESVDFTRACPFECTYCYVNSPIVQEQIRECPLIVDPESFTPTREQAFIEYLQARRKLVGNYFLRFLSLSDCPMEYFGLLHRLLIICKKEGTDTVVITKDARVVRVAYSVATKVLYSNDRGGYKSPSSTSEYLILKKDYPNLRLFSMVANFRELRFFATAYHTLGILPTDVQYVAFHGQIHDTELTKAPVDAPALIKPMFLQMLTGRACCAKGLCISCTLRCGINDAREYTYNLVKRKREEDT